MGTVPSKSASGSKGRNRGIANLIPFKPGQSGNPLGRWKNDKLAAHIRESTNGGKELCDYVLERFRAPIPPDAGEKVETACREEKMEAATWLADRGFAKPKPIEEESNPGQIGMTLVQILVSMGPDVVRDLNRKLIEASGDVVDALPGEK